VQQEREEAQQAKREEELKKNQQQLNQAFTKIAILLKLPAIARIK